MQTTYGTAKIYQFPVRSRTATAVVNDQAATTTAREIAAPRVDFGSWYHDEAIKDDADKAARSPIRH